MFPARWCARLVVLSFLGVPLAGAQVTSADLVGRVTDSTTAVLPGATVTIEHTGTGDTRTQVANEAGDYVFTLLPIGRYTIKIELQGFGTQTGTVALATGDRARLDFKLSLGRLAETITVSGEAPLLQTTSATSAARSRLSTTARAR